MSLYYFFFFLLGSTTFQHELLVGARKMNFGWHENHFIESRDMTFPVYFVCRVLEEIFESVYTRTNKKDSLNSTRRPSSSTRTKHSNKSAATTRIHIEKINLRRLRFGWDEQKKQSRPSFGFVLFHWLLGNFTGMFWSSSTNWEENMK